MKTTVTLLLVHLSLTIIAQTDFQPGYFITHDNDTIHGLIDYRGAVRNSKICSYKADEHTKTISFTPPEIKAYRFIDSKYFVSKKIPSADGIRQVFLEFLVDGITNLYFLGEDGYGVYLFENEQGRIYELSNERQVFEKNGVQYMTDSKRYIGLLRATFADCRELQPEIDKVLLSHRSLIKLTKNYHDLMCDEEQCIVYEKKLRGAKVQLVPTAGINTMFLNFNKWLFSKFEYQQRIGYQAGVMLNTTIPRFNEKVTFEAEISLQNSNIYGTYSHEVVNKTSYTADLNLVSLQPSVAFRYSFPSGTIRPTFAAGLFTAHFISRNEEVIRTSILEPFGMIIISRLPGTPLTDFIWGGVVQAGCNFDISNINMFTSMKYNHGQPRRSTIPDVEYLEVKNYYRAVSLSVGIYL